MIKEPVEKVMRNALLAFAQKEGKPVISISVFIHTKPTEDEPELFPKYFYTVDGNSVTEEYEDKGEIKSRVKDLDFVRDILNKKFDLMNLEPMAGQFLMNYFKYTSEELQVNPKALYLEVTSSDAEAKDIIVILRKGSEVIKKINLGIVFGEEDEHHQEDGGDASLQDEERAQEELVEQ
jgi:hypothetical protein